MKRILNFVMFSMFLVGLTTMSTYASAETKKTMQERNAEYRKEFDRKASKSARKQAKELVKEGWKPIGAGKPIEAQLDRAWQYKEPNEDGEMEYLVETGTSIANTLSTAQAAAKQQARLAIAKSLESEVGSLIEGSLNHAELSDDDVRDVSKMNEVNNTFVHQKLNKSIVISEWYKKTDNGKYKVEVTMALKITTLKEETEAAWLNEVKTKNEALYDKLFDKLQKSKTK